ncbi:hypothetical protein, partial [Selenomonas sp. FOBRC9]|uniref:hypothetical protein n=1 Tax=Selenomonas sp. FOBRC9 TaxID=936573 RepID=UPI001E413C36
LSRRVAVFLYCNISELNRATKEFFSVSLNLLYIAKTAGCLKPAVFAGGTREKFEPRIFARYMAAVQGILDVRL